MSVTSLLRFAWIASVICVAIVPASGTLRAASFPEFVDPNPAAGNGFGSAVVPLSTGNVVITSPNDDAGGSNAGAVYLFNGSTGALISTLRGSTANDNVGSGGVTALTNGNYVVLSLNWDNGATVNAGAASWGSGTTGVSGTVSTANSLVGSTANDLVGSGGVTALTNGNYVVGSSLWNNGPAVDAGAASWGSGTSGVSGTVSDANSLVGISTGDLVSNLGVTALTNGNYVVRSHNWDNGATGDAGAATWASGTTGVSGAVSAANSLVGSTTGDQVSGGGVTALPSGNYVVRSSNWDNGAFANAGAVTWGSGTTGPSGAVSAANSLVGSTAGDQIGSLGVTVLENGNYVVHSSVWDNGATVDAGAVTWGSGTAGVSGTVSAANSLVGTTAGDQVGGSGVTPLTNGNYVVRSSVWDNGATADAGAATWGNGTTGVIGSVSAANSLVGSTAGDQVGVAGVMPLTNGNYVVRSSNWDNGANANAGAATWGSGTTGVSGTVSVVNSLVGSISGDQVGSGCVALSNGNYVVSSSSWDNGAFTNVGAATWGSGATGISGVVSAGNSLVGSTAGDLVGGSGVTALTNGNYLVRSSSWDNGAVANAGAVTWGSGTTGVSGTVSTANSLVGSTANDQVGGTGVAALSSGSYVVRSSNWDNGAAANAGAATWGIGTTAMSGSVSAANSLVGSTAGDAIGSGGVAALSNGDYVVTSPLWNSGATADAGAATWGSGGAGVVGAVSTLNSLVGSAASTNLQAGAVDDVVNDNFISQFLAEGGGRVRVGPTNTPILVSAVDIPNDQGGWLRLTFLRSSQDDFGATPPVATYGVWRHVPGTSPARAGRVDVTRSGRLGAAATALLRSTLPAGLEVWEEGGRLLVTMPDSRSAEIAAAFPAGTWELLTSVPAAQQAQYVVAVPSISNAAPNDFVVTAHTTTPAFWVRSNTLSGQSVDNLAPAQPTGITAGYSGGQTNLQWAANSENDLDTYRLYRGSSAGFTPSVGNRIASPAGTSYADAGPPGSFYKLSAEDVNGNESTFALITPDGTTGVGDGAAVAFALEGARPNPATGNSLNVAFALPSGAPARLELLDVSGRLVLAREVGALGAGRHTVSLGRGVQAGIYWVKLTQGPAQHRKRVTVIE